MSVTIEDVMAIADDLADDNIFAEEGFAGVRAREDKLRAALSALVAQARDEEAEACAKVVEAIPKMAAFMSDMPVQGKCAQAIRARIAGRK